MVDFNKPLTTRDGCGVKIYTTQAANTEFPIHGCIVSPVNGCEQMHSWRANGKKFEAPSSQSPADLINPTIKVSVERWINLYADGTCGGTLHTTQAAAILYQMGKPGQAVEVTIEAEFPA